MDRRIKNWMLISIAIVLIEVSSFVGVRWQWHTVEIVLYSMAAVLVIIAIIRWLLEKLKK